MYVDALDNFGIECPIYNLIKLLKFYQIAGNHFG